jgi:hypothetical protein
MVYRWFKIILCNCFVKTANSKILTTHQTASIFAFEILVVNDDFIGKLIVVHLLYLTYTPTISL